MTHLSALILSLPRLGAYLTLRLALVILDAAERLRGMPSPPPVLCLGCGKPLRGHAREERDRCKDAVRRAWSSGKMPMPRVPDCNGCSRADPHKPGAEECDPWDEDGGRPVAPDPLRVPWAAEEKTPEPSHRHASVLHFGIPDGDCYACDEPPADRKHYTCDRDIFNRAGLARCPDCVTALAKEEVGGGMVAHDPAALDAEELATVTGEPAPSSPPAPVPAVERLRGCSVFARPKGGGK